jgi:hypothetical protein
MERMRGQGHDKQENKNKVQAVRSGSKDSDATFIPIITT